MRGLFLLSVFFLTLSSFGSQAVIIDTQFNPPTFHVGDLVELLIEFRVESDVSIQIPEVLLEAEWIDIRDVRLDKGEDTYSIHIDFTPFATGIRTLPPLDLGAIRLANIKISTSSMLPSAHENARLLRGQILIPGTRLGLVIILTLIAMSPFLIRWIYKIISRLFRSIGRLFLIGRPFRRLLRLLKKLGSDIESSSESDWYSTLTKGLRDYLSERIEYNCKSATTSAISARIDSVSTDSPQGRILQVLKDGDMVKFAGQNTDASQREQTLTTVKSAVIDWEKAIVQH